MLSPKVISLLDTVPKFKRWLEATVQNDTVKSIYNEERVVARTKKRRDDRLAAAAAGAGK